MKIKFKKLRENAKLPTKAHDDDFCYDVYACGCEEVAPNVYKYPLGFALQIEDKENVYLEINNGDESILGVDFLGLGPTLHLKRAAILSVDFRPRSSIWKTGMVLCNSCGTVK